MRKIRLHLLWIFSASLLIFQNCGEFSAIQVHGTASLSTRQPDGGKDTSKESKDKAAKLAVSDVTVAPGEKAVLTVSLDRAISSALSFTYETADDTATADVNYLPLSGSLTLPAGELQATVEIQTVISAGDIERKFSLNFDFPQPFGKRSAVVTLSSTMSPPVTLKNKWTSLSLGANAPSKSTGHVAVWTGSKMIVWSGGDSLSGSNKGAIYDPQTGTWQAMSRTGAPSSRLWSAGVWTGTKMVVWGGYNDDRRYNDGGIYDPATDTWKAISTAGAPSARGQHMAVWTGSKMIVWGGFANGGVVNDGGIYDPRTDSWSEFKQIDPPAPRAMHVMAWTGSKMIVLGGMKTKKYSPTTGDAVNGWASYDPVTTKWTALSSAGAPADRRMANGVWTGTQLIVWGGIRKSEQLKSGAIYDQATGQWAPMTTSGAPSARWSFSLVWTGKEALLLGGAFNNRAISGFFRYE